MSLGKRARVGGDEQDAFSKRGRQYLCYLQRPGVRKAIKTRARRRERRQARQRAREGED